MHSSVPHLPCLTAWNHKAKEIALDVLRRWNARLDVLELKDWCLRHYGETEIVEHHERDVSMMINDPFGIVLPGPLVTKLNVVITPRAYVVVSDVKKRIQEFVGHAAKITDIVPHFGPDYPVQLVIWLLVLDYEDER